ncbi:uncharacterized protein [Triticum aestivum]|uniref:uncharacterized protein n=1 Tax=Triticum aestivum TaxID=4565 RepID=UPI001D006F6B|nr:uncharacterized protein LOC123038204 [Triticum aestivum]
MQTRLVEGGDQHRTRNPTQERKRVQVGEKPSRLSGRDEKRRPGRARAAATRARRRAATRRRDPPKIPASFLLRVPEKTSRAWYKRGLEEAGARGQSRGQHRDRWRAAGCTCIGGGTDRQATEPGRPPAGKQMLWNHHARTTSSKAMINFNVKHKKQFSRIRTLELSCSVLPKNRKNLARFL